MAIPNPSTVTVQETVTATVTQAGPSAAQQPPPTQAHPFPHAFPFAGPPPPMGYMPPVLPVGGPPPIAGQPGTLVSPFAAVLCILTVAGCYWAFKYLPQMQQQGSSPSAAPATDAKDSKDKDKDKTSEDSAGSGGTIPSITPAAFISLFCFALLAAVIVQGPLGLSSAFAGQEASIQPTAGSRETGNNLLSTFKLLEVLGVGGSQREAPRPDSNVSKLGGQFNAVGPGGASSSNWFISSGTGDDTTRQVNQGKQLSIAEALTLAGLPPALQELDLCRRDPKTCAAIVGATGAHSLPGSSGNPLNGAGGGSIPAQPKPVPLIPQQGFLGSYQGLKSLENAFYPMLIGAIGLIVLFDYGT